MQAFVLCACQRAYIKHCEHEWAKRKCKCVSVAQDIQRQIEIEFGKNIDRVQSWIQLSISVFLPAPDPSLFLFTSFLCPYFPFKYISLTFIYIFAFVNKRMFTTINIDAQCLVVVVVVEEES